MKEYDEWVKKQNNKGKFHFRLFENAKPIHWVLLIGLFILASFLAKSKQSKFVWIGFGILIAVFIISMFKQGEKKEPLPRSLAQEIALHDLESEIGPGKVFPLGTKIVPLGYYKDQVKIEPTGPMLLKYNLGFKITEPYIPEYEICYQMDPITGRCKGWIDVPFGFTGQDIKDLEIIFPEKIIKEEPENRKV